MSAKRIPVTFMYPALALCVRDAAKAMGTSRQTVWRLTATGKIKKTEYGTIPVTELQRHLDEEMQR